MKPYGNNKQQTNFDWCQFLKSKASITPQWISVNINPYTPSVGKQANTDYTLHISYIETENISLTQNGCKLQIYAQSTIIPPLPSQRTYIYIYIYYDWYVFDNDNHQLDQNVIWLPNATKLTLFFATMAE